MEDYLPIHEFIDSSKQVIGDVRHRILYHHPLGVFLCERIFGKTITVQKNTKTVEVPVRLIAEQHILEDLARAESPDRKRSRNCSARARSVCTGQRKASRPVRAFPTVSRWISWVPS